MRRILRVIWRQFVQRCGDQCCNCTKPLVVVRCWTAAGPLCEGCAKTLSNGTIMFDLKSQ